MSDALAICRRNTEIARHRALQQIQQERTARAIADPAPDYRDQDVERLRMAMVLINQSETPYRRDFPSYLADNFHVFKAFEREADKIWNRGRRHYSGRTIIEVLRHESALADDGHEFKLNNNWTPDLCRLYMQFHPERVDIFETRTMPSDVRAA